MATGTTLFCFRRTHLCHRPPWSTATTSSLLSRGLPLNRFNSAGYSFSKCEYVAPGQPLLSGLAKEKSRVQHGHGGYRSAQTLLGVGEPAAAQARYTPLLPQQSLGRHIANQQEVLRLHQDYMAFDEGQAEGNLPRFRCSISRRPPEEKVGDEDIFWIESRLSQQPVQKLSGRSDERPAL